MVAWKGQARKRDGADANGVRTAATFSLHFADPPTFPELALSISSVLRHGLLAFLASFQPALAGAIPVTTKPQYLIISFDGAQPIEQWRRSRALARQTGAEFTYFLSCVYLLTREDRNLYKAPGQSAGRSNVGYAESRDDIAKRLRQIWTARLEGHEIASHGCGHFDGGGWTSKEWQAEFGEFDGIVSRAWQINGIPFEPEGWRGFVEDEIVGFRAPYLSTGAGLFEALAKDGYLYDASGVSDGPARPVNGAGPIRFALPMIPEGAKGRPVIAMDYNLFVRHSGGEETADEDGAFEERTLAAFKAALATQLSGDHIPLQIGYHFTLMNGGAYWRALERFTKEACARRDVRCVSYRTYLEETAGEHAGG